MKITDKKYFSEYQQLVGKDVPKLLAGYDFSEVKSRFEYLTKTSCLYSSKIEGNRLDLNSFMNYDMNPAKSKGGKEFTEIEDLIVAYQFAQNNTLNEQNLLHCHKIFSKTLVQKSRRGVYRSEKVGVFGRLGLVYLAVEPEFVQTKMQDYFDQISQLLKTTLDTSEVFYFASLAHLKFSQIHPFSDGNGRAARLIEKWFLATKLGKKLWQIPTEEYYFTNQRLYYKNINLGVNFYELNYDKCLPFLQMLPCSLIREC